MLLLMRVDNIWANQSDSVSGKKLKKKNYYGDHHLNDYTMKSSRFHPTRRSTCVHSYLSILHTNSSKYHYIISHSTISSRHSIRTSKMQISTWRTSISPKHSKNLKNCTYPHMQWLYHHLTTRTRHQIGHHHRKSISAPHLRGISKTATSTTSHCSAWPHYFSTAAQGALRKGERTSPNDRKLAQCAFSLRRKDGYRGQGILFST